MKPATDIAANSGGDTALISAIVIGAVIVAFAIIVAVAMVLRNKNKKD